MSAAIVYAAYGVAGVLLAIYLYEMTSVGAFIDRILSSHTPAENSPETEMADVIQFDFPRRKDAA